MKQESETWRPDIEDNDTQHISKKMTNGSKTECYCAKCCYAQYRGAKIKWSNKIK
jgi:hypothetical protein